MFFIGLGTAVPPRQFAQLECLEAFQRAPQYSRLNSRSQAVLRKVLSGHNGITTRHFAVEKLTDAFALNPDALHTRFSQHAPALAAQAAERALADARIAPEEIDAVIISTCTGYLCPGLTSYVSERLGLRADAQALDLVGQGCGAALPNLRAAEALITSRRCGRVLSVCVEVCSAALYLDDDPGVLISACLFGDGAGAAVVSAHASTDKRRLEWKRGETLLSAVDRDYLKFEQRSGMLRNVLARQVPSLAAKHVETLLTEMLANSALERRDIAGWMLHPGGRDVLKALQARLGLTEEDLRWSAAVLNDYGNISSASLYFVLQRALAGEAAGGYWWLSSFGAGFSCHGAFLKVE